MIDVFRLLTPSDSQLVARLLVEENYVLREPVTWETLEISDLIQPFSLSEPRYKVAGSMFEVYKSCVEGKLIAVKGYSCVKPDVAFGYSQTLDLGYLRPPNQAAGWFIFSKTNTQVQTLKVSPSQLAVPKPNELKSEVLRSKDKE